MKYLKTILSLLTLILLPVSCEGLLEDEYVIPDVSGISFVNRCDFEKVVLDFTPKDGCKFKKVSNPLSEGINRSSTVGRVTRGAKEWDYVISSVLPRKLDFTANAAIIKMNVLPPKAGARVIMKLSCYGGKAIDPVEVEAKTSVEGEWETLYFDFSKLSPESNFYQKISIYFDAGVASEGDKWYFDSILCPSDDLTDICLFQRYPSNPVFNPDNSGTWRGAHMANVGILPPSLSPDGNWWLYLRGSGSCPQYCDQIGLYTQEASKFKPFGPWDEYANNPVLPVGPAGSFDSGFLLDTAPVVGPDGTVYVYYNGKPSDQSSSGLCVRYSTDGGYTFQGLDAPLIVGMGCSDAVYHDGKFYIFYGGGNPCKLYVSVTEDPLSLKNAKRYATIPIGGGPSNFDSKAVNGSMVFRLEGVDKWFACYQGSSNSYDFPDRFHIAISDDLIHWTKVRNDQPLFTRGSVGTWDQGAIWGGEIFEYAGKLYLYYEGWGRTGNVPNRDEPYFSGRSREGAASCDKDEFLKWCKLK